MAALTFPREKKLFIGRMSAGDRGNKHFMSQRHVSGECDAGFRKNNNNNNKTRKKTRNLNKHVVS